MKSRNILLAIFSIIISLVMIIGIFDQELKNYSLVKSFVIDEIELDPSRDFYDTFHEVKVIIEASADNGVKALLVDFSVITTLEHSKFDTHYILDEGTNEQTFIDSWGMAEGGGSNYKTIRHASDGEVLRHYQKLGLILFKTMFPPSEAVIFYLLLVGSSLLFAFLQGLFLFSLALVRMLIDFACSFFSVISRMVVIPLFKKIVKTTSPPKKLFFCRQVWKEAASVILRWIVLALGSRAPADFALVNPTMTWTKKSEGVLYENQNMSYSRPGNFILCRCQG